MYVDALCMQMVRDPRQFDVIVTNNMFGDIITDLAAGLQGGLGMAASGNIHPGKTSMFEPVHGSAPPIAGKNMANPFGAILTAAMMLRHLGLAKEADNIEAAVLEAVRQKRTTEDIGGSLGTKEAGEWVAEGVRLRERRMYDVDERDLVVKLEEFPQSSVGAPMPSVLAERSRSIRR